MQSNEVACSNGRATVQARGVVGIWKGLESRASLLVTGSLPSACLVRHLALSTNCIDKMISLPALKNIEVHAFHVSEDVEGVRNGHSRLQLRYL